MEANQVVIGQEPGIGTPELVAINALYLQVFDKTVSASTLVCARCGRCATFSSLRERKKRFVTPDCRVHDRLGLD